MNHPDSLAVTLSNNLKAYRKEMGFSQETLAEKADLSLQMIRGIETRRVWPAIPTLDRIANCLGVTIDRLLVSAMVSPPSRERLTTLLADCSDQELDSIYAVVREVKGAIRR